MTLSRFFADLFHSKDSRTVIVQRRTRGELVGPRLEVRSDRAAVERALDELGEPRTELRIFGSARALRRLGAEKDPTCFPHWGFESIRVWVPCYEGEPS